MSACDKPETSSTYSQGPHTLRVSCELFALNRKRLCERLREVGGVKNNAVVVLQGGVLQNLYDTDVEHVFRQEQYFFWAFGVHEDGCYGAIHVPSGDAYLFIPKQSEEMAMWVGKLPSCEEFRQKYKVKDVYYADKTGDQVRPYADPLDGYPQVNGVDSQEIANAGRRSLTCRELIALVKDYVRRSKERPPIHLVKQLENAQDKLMVAAGVSPRKRIANHQKSTAAKKTRHTHKVSERMVAGQTANAGPRKRAAAPAVDVSEFTGLKDRDRLPGHEYPCVCDLSLPRKSLSETERTQKGTAYMKHHQSSPARKIPPRNLDPAKLGVQTFTETGDSQSVDGNALAIETTATEKASREPTTRRQPSPPDSPAPTKTGRPPMRSPPRLKLTVAQSPKTMSSAPNKRAAGKGFDKVRMNRAAFLRFEHTKYCGRGLTLSLMGGARLREEELALLKAKKEKTNKLLRGRKGGKGKGPKKFSKRELKKMKEEEERQKALAERRDEEMRMSRLNSVMDGRTCSYFECWVDQAQAHRAKGRKMRGDVVHVQSVMRKLPPRKAKK